MCTRIPAIVLASALLPSQENADLSVQQIYDRAGERRAVALDEEVSATLSPGQGIRLECAENAIGLASAVLLLAEDGVAWVAARDTDGYTIEHGGSNSREYPALLTQLGRTEVVLAASWSWSDDQASVSLRLSTDPARNQELRKRAREGDPPTAYRLRNGAPFLAVEIPEDERIAGWARLWSEVKYNFAFFDQVPDVDWDAELAAVMPAIRAARTAPAYYRVLNRSLARLRDGHTDIWGPGIGVQGDARLPVRLEFDTERRLRIAAVVSLDVVPSDAARAEIAAAELVRGEQISHWNDRPVDELLEAEIRPYICASTPQSSDLEAARVLMAGAPGSRVTLGVIGSDGRGRNVSLPRARYPVPGRVIRRFEVRELEGGVVYVNLPSFGDESIVEQFEKELPRIRRARALIFDVRGNGGGSSGNAWRIVSHVIDRSIPKTTWKTRLYRPAHRAWGNEEEWHHGEPGRIAPAVDPFDGPVAVLVGPATFSAAEDFVAVLHASKRANVVGRPTGGSTGQPLKIELPGGGGARVCTKRDTYPDGRDFVGIGIQPDVVVDPMQQPRHDDPELARALEVVSAAAEGK